MSKLILIVDDEQDICRSLAGILEDEGYQVVTAPNGSEALEVAREEVPDLVLLDIWMPGMDGIQTLERIKNLFPELIVVMMSGHGTIETAVRATKLGAFDFVEKPFSLDKVLITLANAISIKELRKENNALRLATLDQHELVGCSPALENLREQVLRVAPASTPVLIVGEHGVGKELAARSIHYYSPRREKPFVGINCTAIPGELLTGELFGYEKDAFIGANNQRRGRFDLADCGTVFLDEIQELPIKAQGELVRVLRERCFERLGGVRPVRIDVRVIAASSVSLRDWVRDGLFREDLFQLLSVVPLTIPPLRERQEDIPHLVRYFINHFYCHEGWEPKHFSDDAMRLLQDYNWPGNVRELKNIVERVLIMAEGPDISADEIPVLTPHLGGEQATGVSSDEYLTFSSAMKQFEKEYIRQKLEECAWDIEATARAIDLERTVFHRKLLQYGLVPEFK